MRDGAERVSKRWRGRLVGVVCVAALPALSACGGGSSQPSGSSAKGGPTTHDEIVRRGDAICQRYRASARSLHKPSVASGADLGAFLNKLADVAEPAAHEMSALTPGPSDRVAFTKYTTGLNTQVQLIRRSAREFSSGSSQAGQTDLRAAEQAGPEVKGLAQGFGFHVCGSSGL